MRPWLTLILMLWLTGCMTTNTTMSAALPVQTAVSFTSNTAIPKPFNENKPMPSEQSPVAELVPREIIEKAKTDLSQRSHIDAEQIHVAEARSVTWPDASTGCVQPDEKEAKGAIPGYQIRLEAGGRYYVYRVDQAGPIILCPEPKPDEPGLR
jgi:hypothetical protein